MKNPAIAIALMKNVAGKTLVAQTKQSLRQAELSREEEYQDRKAQIKKLMDLARLPMKAEEGCTSRAERLGKQLARQGGEEFEEACRLLKFANYSDKDWATAIDCFA